MGKSTGPTYRVAFKRRRLGLTNYKKRFALLKSGKPRFVVRKSQRNIITQVLDYDTKGDRVLASAHSCELKKFGWPVRSNTPTAYLTGLLAGLRAVKNKVIDAVPDIGLNRATRGSVVFSAIKGAIDGGMKISMDPAMVSENRIKGEHIAGYSKYPEAKNIVELFEKVKEEIIRSV
ncbi:MAG: 50S ribosomal protein L18 [Candidatus Micrarchaeia archaeon]